MRTKPQAAKDTFPFYRCLRPECLVWREGGAESARRHIISKHDPQRLSVTWTDVEWSADPSFGDDVDFELALLPGRAMFIDGRA